jgi:hypothetical protein
MGDNGGVFLTFSASTVISIRPFHRVPVLQGLQLAKHRCPTYEGHSKQKFVRRNGLKYIHHLSLQTVTMDPWTEGLDV